MTHSLVLSLFLAGCAHAGQTNSDRVVLHHALPAELGAGSSLQLVEVAYAPGGSSGPHHHPCPGAVYVVSGAIRTQLAGGAETVYRAGQSFYESPTDVHLISANASTETGARFVAFFVCRDDAPLSVPASAGVGR